MPVTVHADAKSASLSIQSGRLRARSRRASPSITPPPPPPPPPYAPIDWRALDLGGQAGAFFPPEGPTRIDDRPSRRATTKRSRAGPLVGLRLGFFPIPRIGLEAEVSLIEAGLADESGSRHLLASRGTLAVRAIETSRVGVRMLVGAGADARRRMRPKRPGQRRCRVDDRDEPEFVAQIPDFSTW